MKFLLSCCGMSYGRDRQGELDARISQKEIVPLYDSLSKYYDVWGLLAESRARKRAIELAGVKNGEAILEVAVGTGLAFYELAKRNPHGSNLGIDLSTGMLNRARKRLGRLPHKNYELKVASAFHIPAQDEQFDLLLNNYMFDLMAFQEMDAILEEFNRVLKKGGRLVLVNMTKGERFGSGFYDVLFRLSPRIIGGCRGVNLKGLLAKHDFHVNTREYHQQLFFPSEVIAADK